MLAALLSEKPKLHHWGGQWRDGGLGDHVLRELFELTSSMAHGETVVLETGAGLSTLVFLAAQPKKLITIAPSQDLKNRIDAEIARFLLNAASHAFYVDRSEVVLPELAKSAEPYLDLALVEAGGQADVDRADRVVLRPTLRAGESRHRDCADVQGLSAVLARVPIRTNKPGGCVFAQHSAAIAAVVFPRRTHVEVWSARHSGTALTTLGRDSPGSAQRPASAAQCDHLFDGAPRGG